MFFLRSAWNRAQCAGGEQQPLRTLSSADCVSIGPHSRDHLRVDVFLIAGCVFRSIAFVVCAINSIMRMSRPS